jgi:hypothetical protein
LCGQPDKENRYLPTTEREGSGGEQQREERNLREKKKERVRERKRE